MMETKLLLIPSPVSVVPGSIPLFLFAAFIPDLSSFDVGAWNKISRLAGEKP